MWCREGALWWAVESASAAKPRPFPAPGTVYCVPRSPTPCMLCALCTAASSAAAWPGREPSRSLLLSACQYLRPAGGRRPARCSEPPSQPVCLAVQQQQAAAERSRPLNRCLHPRTRFRQPPPNTLTELKGHPPKPTAAARVRQQVRQCRSCSRGGPPQLWGHPAAAPSGPQGASAHCRVCWCCLAHGLMRCTVFCRGSF